MKADLHECATNNLFLYVYYYIMRKFEIDYSQGYSYHKLEITGELQKMYLRSNHMLIGAEGGLFTIDINKSRNQACNQRNTT